MAIGITLLFWLAVGLIFTTYVAYPVGMIFIRKNQSEPTVDEEHINFPKITVLFAAYNEEAVIADKIHSIYNTNYPSEKVNVLIGSDNSTDKTDEIVLNLSRQYPSLQLVKFVNRTGKAGIINKLVSIAETEIIVATDANILFLPHTIGALVAPFANDKIKLVGGNLTYQTLGKTGIALQEHMYLSWENRLKHAESQRWGIVMGVEGGCYAIKKSWFAQIPPLTFMEDFYITLSVLARKGNVYFAQNATCIEDVSTQLSEEFKRKVRISIGNWQNLNHFSKLLSKPFSPVGFAFLCHKVLRWFTPFLAIFAIGSAAVLAANSSFYGYFLFFLVVILLLLPLDFLLMKRNIETGALRFVNHFLMMNVALLIGFAKYTKGIKSNVWQPTKRNQ